MTGGTGQSFIALFQAFTIATYRLKQQEIAGADLVIAPELGRTSGQWGFSERERLVAAAL